MVEVCPCCGHPVLDIDDVLTALTPLQKRVFKAIKRAGAGGVPGPQLMDIVYADDPTGGPESTNIIAVVAKQMNSRLVRFGLKLVGKRGAGGFYTLKTLEQVEHAANG